MRDKGTFIHDFIKQTSWRVWILKEKQGKVCISPDSKEVLFVKQKEDKDEKQNTP